MFEGNISFYSGERTSQGGTMQQLHSITTIKTILERCL